MNSHVNDNSSAEELNRSITWQYDNAPNLVALIDMLGGFFDKSTTELWDSWKSKVNDIDTADDFGLTIWGKIMDCPRPMLTIGGEEVNLSTETYRSILKARARLLASHGTVPDYQNYIATAFDGHFIVKDGNDMGLTFVATDGATAEEIALSDQFPDIAFLWPDGVRDSYEEPEGMFGFLGSDGIPTFDKVRVGKSDPYTPYVEFVLAEKADGDQYVSLAYQQSASHPSTLSIVYMTSYDNDWKDYEIGTNIVIHKIGDWIRFRAKTTNETLFVDGYYHQFKTNGKYYCNGDVKFLLDSKGDITSLNGQNALRLLFYNTSIISAPRISFREIARFACGEMFVRCRDLVEAPELPATTLADSCYYDMFGSCTSLTKAPELPATTLADSCYSYMFSNCTSLAKAPELPATTLANKCYSHMFNGCSSLTEIPELPATTLANECYSHMFQGCTSLTEFPEFSKLLAPTLAQNCYYRMFDGCTFTEVPDLPERPLTDYCYAGIFAGLSNLTKAPKLPATELARGCYSEMFRDCTSLTNPPELPAMTIADWCYYSMFRGCTSLTKAPELPAMTMADYCYSEMFRDCTSFTNPPELPATTLYNFCYEQMFNGCTSLTKAPELPATTLANRCCYRLMFAHTSVNNIKIHYTGNFSGIDNSFYYWVNDVPASGDFYYNGSDTTRGISAIPEGWTVHTF